MQFCKCFSDWPCRNVSFFCARTVVLQTLQYALLKGYILPANSGSFSHFRLNTLLFFLSYGSHRPGFENDIFRFLHSFLGSLPNLCQLCTILHSSRWIPFGRFLSIFVTFYLPSYHFLAIFRNEITTIMNPPPRLQKGVTGGGHIFVLEVPDYESAMLIYFYIYITGSRKRALMCEKKFSEIRADKDTRKVLSVSRFCQFRDRFFRIFLFHKLQKVEM